MEHYCSFIYFSYIALHVRVCSQVDVRTKEHKLYLFCVVPLTLKKIDIQRNGGWGKFLQEKK